MIMKINAPTPTGREIKLSSEQMLVSKTDAHGNIVYSNECFVDVSGYSKEELIGTPHNILRHPDMPKAIFYLMWREIRRGNNIIAVVKNLSKSGDHYWVTTDFEIKKTREGKIRNYMAFRQSAPRNVIKVIEPLYKKMLEIEATDGMDGSVEYLEKFLKKKRMSYNEFIQDLATPTSISSFFKKMKELFPA